MCMSCGILVTTSTRIDSVNIHCKRYNSIEINISIKINHKLRYFNPTVRK